MEITNKRIRHLVHDHPEWLSVIEACIDVARTVHPEFAGAWVHRHMRDTGHPGFPNLRVLVRNDVLEKVRSSRGGKRAYYIFSDLEEAEQTVHSLRAEVSS
jgi:hypothetical protein